VFCKAQVEGVTPHSIEILLQLAVSQLFTSIELIGLIHSSMSGVCISPET